jgi:hypothetical protein
VVTEDSESIQQHIVQQQELIKNYKRKHTNKRETWLEGLAKALADDDGSSSGDTNQKRLRYIKALQQREQQRLSARIIRQNVHAENNYQQLDHITFATDEGVLQTTYDNDEMEQQLIAENQRRFNQANGSPFQLMRLTVTWITSVGCFSMK